MVFLGLNIRLKMSMRGSGTGTTAVKTSSLPLLTAPVGRSLRVSALKMVVFPLFGRPMMPSRMECSYPLNAQNDRVQPGQIWKVYRSAPGKKTALGNATETGIVICIEPRYDTAQTTLTGQPVKGYDKTSTHLLRSSRRRIVRQWIADRQICGRRRR